MRLLLGRLDRLNADPTLSQTVPNPQRQRRSFNISLGHRPRRNRFSKTSAESAPQSSIPNVALIEIDFVLAQQLAILLLKRANTMVILLSLDVLQHSFELTRAYRKCAVAALPEKTAIARIKRFDPFRRCFLSSFDEFSLRNSARQRGDNVNMISNTADMHKVHARVAADRCQICMHARAHICVEPRLAILCTKDDVNDDFTEGLGHHRILEEKYTKVNRAFSALRFLFHDLGRCPRLKMIAAPLAPQPGALPPGSK